MALALGAVVTGRGTPRSITVDNGTEFASKVMDLWAYRNSVHLDFIRPERPVENWYIESFNGRLRDECLNVEVFFTLADARRKLALWHHDYNYHRPHSAERETPRQPLQGEGFMTLPPVLRTEEFHRSLAEAICSVRASGGDQAMCHHERYGLHFVVRVSAHRRFPGSPEDEVRWRPAHTPAR